MLFNVPQFIEIEDKIVGPLTAKQLGWMGAAVVLLLVFWNMLDTSTFIVAAIIVLLIFGALAFYRPYNQPLSSFLASSFHFVLSPKIYIWKRRYNNIHTVSRSAKKTKEKPTPKKKTINRKKLEELSKMLNKRK